MPRTPDEAPIARGALFGPVVYGVYDLSNLSNLKRGPVLLTAVDIAWGAVALLPLRGWSRPDTGSCTRSVAAERPQ